MLTLDLTNDPRWVELAPGVRVQLRPLTTALMVATRKDPAVAALPEPALDAVTPDADPDLETPTAEDVSEEERALIFAKALARRAVLAWEGVGDANGNAVDPSPPHIDALLGSGLIASRLRVLRERWRTGRPSDIYRIGLLRAANP